MKRFTITGVAGYIAPRHLQAIHDTGNTLVAALDPHDSVGILDRWFPEAAFFTESERFDRYLEKCRRDPGNEIDYLSICAPNYLHDAHIRMALRSGADAICEKPLVLNPWNLNALAELESEAGKRVWTVLQLRLHPELVQLKKQIRQNSGHHDVQLTYIAPRGNWYQYSWKGNGEKSGGVIANIGVHFFDLLHWLFGKRSEIDLLENNEFTCAGKLELENASIDWLLSIDPARMPHSDTKSQIAHRKMCIDGNEVDFSSGFVDLHTAVYQGILNGEGFGIEDARPAIETIYEIRKLQRGFSQ